MAGGVFLILSGFAAPTVRILLPGLILLAAIHADQERINNGLVCVTVNNQAYEQAETHILLDDAVAGPSPDAVYVPSSLLCSDSRLGKGTGCWTYWIKFDTPENAAQAAPLISGYLKAKYGLVRGKPRFIVQRTKR
jgi:hypothetical protein